jgi:hypothetical protein
MNVLFAIFFSLNLVIESVISAYLTCSTCSNKCPAKGQYLFSFDTVDLFNDANEAQHYKRLTNRGHSGWELTASLRDGLARVEFTTGPIWTKHYIMTVLYTSPDEGIKEADYWLDAPDICYHLGTEITPTRLMYAQVFQTKAAARTDDLCSLDPRAGPISSLHKEATFTQRDFRKFNPLSAQEGKFTAEYHINKQMVKLSVAQSQTEFGLFVFDIKHTSREPFQLSLQSGESCWYFLPDNARWDQDFIDVYSVFR